MKDLLSLLPIVAIFLIFWLLVIRPASRRQKEMRQVQRELQVGDEIITNSGIFGTVSRLVDDKLAVEVADGVVVMMARGAVVGVVNEEHEGVRGLDEAAPDDVTAGAETADDATAGAETSDEREN